MKNDEVFDLEKIDDIPDACKKQLKILNVRDDARNLLELFDIKNKLQLMRFWLDCTECIR